MSDILILRFLDKHTGKVTDLSLYELMAGYFPKHRYEYQAIVDDESK
jgi:hypothetical protein